MEDTSSPLDKKMKMDDDDAKEIKTEKGPPLLMPTSGEMNNLIPCQSPQTNPMLVPEIWEQILSYICLTDYLATINTCPEWNHLLNSRKTTELFSMALPSIMKFLPKNDFINLRLVCQDWKRKCEQIYDNHPSRLATATSDLQFPALYSDGKMFPRDDDGVKFQSVESFQRFTTEMGNDCGNPFPGRCVWLLIKEKEDSDSDDYNSDEEIEQVEVNPQIALDYWNAINQLLLQFGEHIWYLQLDYHFDSDWNVERKLKGMLLQVPNLKRLRLSLGDPKTDFTDDSSEFNNRAVEFYKQNPPPKFEYLEIFSYSRDDDEDYDCFDHFVYQLIKSYCPSNYLKRLNIYDMLYSPIPLPNLIELRALISYEELVVLKEASPKLESFSTNIQFDNGVVYASEYQDDHWDDYDSVDNNIGVVFKGMQIFADTLKELYFCPEPFTSNWKTRNFKVMLPKLEKLDITYSLPIHHLLELKSLKYLEIDESPIFKDETYCSDIFEQLPKLQKIVHTNKKRRRVVVRPIKKKM